MPFYKISELEKVSLAVNPGGEYQPVVGELMKSSIVTFRKGTGSTPHSHPNEEQFILVLEGRRYFIVGDEERIIEPGDLVHVPRGTVHGGRTLDDTAVMFVVKSPAGDGRLDQDHNDAENVEELKRHLNEKVKELT